MCFQTLTFNPIAVRDFKYLFVYPSYDWGSVHIIVLQNDFQKVSVKDHNLSFVHSFDEKQSI